MPSPKPSARADKADDSIILKLTNPRHHFQAHPRSGIVAGSAAQLGPGGAPRHRNEAPGLLTCRKRHNVSQSGNRQHECARQVALAAVLYARHDNATKANRAVHCGVWPTSGALQAARAWQLEECTRVMRTSESCTCGVIVLRAWAVGLGAEARDAVAAGRRGRYRHWLHDCHRHPAFDGRCSCPKLAPLTSCSRMCFTPAA